LDVKGQADLVRVSKKTAMANNNPLDRAQITEPPTATEAVCYVPMQDWNGSMDVQKYARV